MIRNGGAASVGMPILHVRATLPSQDKTQGIQYATHLPGLQDRRPRHVLRGDRNTLRADELRVQIRLPVFQQHLDDLAEVALQLIERLALRVGAGKAGNVTDIQTCVRTTLDHGGKCSHARNVLQSAPRVKDARGSWH